MSAVGLALVGCGAAYTFANSGGLVPHKNCNATAIPAKVGEVLVFSLQPEVRKKVTVESVKLTGPSTGLEVVALGYRQLPGDASLADLTNPATVHSVHGLSLTPKVQQAFVVLVRARHEGIYTVDGFDIRYRQGLIRHQQHYSDAFALRAGPDQSPVTEITFDGCSHWVHS